MTASIVLDKSFVSDLDHFDGFCAKTLRPKKDSDELPFAGLEYLARAEANLVLPGHVLDDLRGGMHTEAVYIDKDDGSKAKCSPWLDTQLSHTPRLMDYLKQKEKAGELRYFASAADYSNAIEKEGLKHCLCVIGEAKLTHDPVVKQVIDGRQRRIADNRNRIGEPQHEHHSAMVSLFEKLPDTPDHANIVLTQNKLLAEKAQAHGTAALSGGDYYAVLNMTGFNDNPRTFVLAESTRALQEQREPHFLPPQPERVAELATLVRTAGLDVADKALAGA